MARDDEAQPRLYLLRCWREAGTHREPDTGWRFSLEAAGGEGRRAFGSLGALVAALGAATLDAGAGSARTDERDDTEGAAR